MGQRLSSTTIAPSIEELLKTKRSMFGSVLPRDYGRIETAQDALTAAAPPPPTVILRLHIIWDNDAQSLDLDRALDLMRQTGAAMVVKVEQVS